MRIVISSDVVDEVVVPIYLDNIEPGNIVSICEGEEWEIARITPKGLVLCEGYGGALPTKSGYVKVTKE